MAEFPKTLGRPKTPDFLKKSYDPFQVEKGLMNGLRGIEEASAGALKRLPGRGLPGKRQAFVNQPKTGVTPSVHPGGKHRLNTLKSVQKNDSASAFGVDHG
jgi:hypothetical protein